MSLWVSLWGQYGGRSGGIQEVYRMEDPGGDEDRMVIYETKSLWVIVGVDISQ